MSKVSITTSKLDALANAISLKSGETVPLTLDEMVQAVDGIETGGGGGITPTGNINISQAGVTDVTNYATATVPEGEIYVQTPHIGFITESGTFKYTITNYGGIEAGDGYGQEGYIADGTWVSETAKGNAISSGTSVTPTESAQTIGGAYTMMQGAVTVNAIPSNYVGTGVARKSSSDLTANGATVTVPSGYYASQATKQVASGTAGTPTATKGAVSNHSVSVTPSVTNTTGYITGSTKTGTAVTVSASELVSGTYNVSSSGTADVTNYASVSVPSLTLPSNTSLTSSGTQKANIYPNYNTDRYINIPAGYNDTAQHYKLSHGTLGTKTITANGTYDPEADDLDGYGVITVNVSGGGGGSTARIGTADVEVSSVSSSISFTGLSGEPTSYYVHYEDNIATGTPSKVAFLVYDGTNFHAQTVTNTSNAQASYDGSSFSQSYSNGTLTITSTGAQFTDGWYDLIYSYDGSSGNIYTEDVQVGSGATSITFTGLEDEPLYWSCVFKSNFSTSSGYQRVMGVGFNGNSSTVGICLDSQSHTSGQYWTSSYSNGSLTITSQGTNAGGYWHQPGYYQLTYAIASASPYEKVTKTYTPTTSQQTDTITPSTGYDAIDRVNVTVEAVPTMTLPSASSSTSSGTSKATITPTSSAQYLNIPVGYNGTAQYYTIAASGGGGGSASIDTKTVTASNRPSSLSFTSMKGQPIAWFLKATFTMTSSSSTYYYVDSMRYNGTNVTGRLFQMGSTRQTMNVTSGYSYTYSGTTLTISSTGNRTTSPGCFYNGSYELVYVY